MIGSFLDLLTPENKNKDESTIMQCVQLSSQIIVKNVINFQ